MRVGVIIVGCFGGHSDRTLPFTWNSDQHMMVVIATRLPSSVRRQGPRIRSAQENMRCCQDLKYYIEPPPKHLLLILIFDLLPSRLKSAPTFCHYFIGNIQIEKERKCYQFACVFFFFLLFCARFGYLNYWGVNRELYTSLSKNVTCFRKKSHFVGQQIYSVQFKKRKPYSCKF